MRWNRHFITRQRLVEESSQCEEKSVTITFYHNKFRFSTPDIIIMFEADEIINFRLAVQLIIVSVAYYPVTTEVLGR